MNGTIMRDTYKGWDVRTEAWLPFYPQLGGKLIYEQYYGDEVALFGTDTGAESNTTNEDLVLPATNKEAAQKFGANVQDGVQGYGIRVSYSQK